MELALEIAQWAKEILARKHEYVIMDTETTGLESNDEVVQIGILSLDGNVLFDSILKPMIPMSQASMDKTGLLPEMLKDAPTYPMVADALGKVLKGKKVLTYNVDFDKKLLLQTIKRYKMIPPAIAGWECAMIKYSAFCGEWWKSKKDFKWQPLPFSKHEAIEDCFAVLDLLHRLSSYKCNMEKGWIWCSTNDYCCRLDFENGFIVEAAPIMRWAIGKPVDLIYSKIKLSLIAWIVHEEENEIRDKKEPSPATLSTQPENRGT